MFTTTQEKTYPANIGEILNKLESVKKIGTAEWQFSCMLDGHKTPKGHGTIKDCGDKAVIFCHGNPDHNHEAYCQYLGYRSLTYNKEPRKKEASQIVATYDYHDEKGQLLYQVVRYQPKDFRQRRPDGKGGWTWNIEGVKRVIYHLPDITKAIFQGDVIYVVEGERDADSLWNVGKVATTSPGGAGNWKPEYAEYLKGASKVVLIPDKDTPGIEYSRQAAKSLEGKVSEIKVITLPGDTVKDVSDWLEQGGCAGDLDSLEQDVSVLYKQDEVTYRFEDDKLVWELANGISFTASNIREERTGVHAKITIKQNYTGLAWDTFNIERDDERRSLARSASDQLSNDKSYGKVELKRDLDRFCAGLWQGYISQYLPGYVAGTDEVQPLRFFLEPYVLEGGGSILFAAPGRGKSFSALLWAVCIDAGIDIFGPVTKAPVLFINLERSRQSMVRRLTMVNKALGLPATRQLAMLNARGKSLAAVMPMCKEFIKEHGIKIIFLDSISRAGYGDLNENRTGNAIVDALSGLCETWVALGHTPRADQTHLTGSMMFDAGADVIIQLLTEKKLDGTLGLGYKLTKQNDLPEVPLYVYALEFSNNQMSKVRKAKPGEFLAIEAERKTSQLDQLIEWVLDQEGGKATATEAENGTGIRRDTISKLFTRSGKFVQVGRDGRNVYYGVKQ
jgi:hypothetical protein